MPAVFPSVALPRFSVVIPLYNKRAFVRRTLETVLAQQYPPHDVVIVDDGSTDDSLAVIADLTEPPVRILRQANAGPGPARNHGARIATGDWIAWIDADDLWHPAHLSRLAETIEAFPDVDLVFTSTCWQVASAIDLDAPLPTDVSPRRYDYFAEANYDSVMIIAMAQRRSAFLETKGFGGYFPGEEMEHLVEFALDHAMAFNPVETAVYIRNNNGIMETNRGTSDERPDRTQTERVLDRALANPRYVDRHRAIARFADGVILNAARNMLYVGNGQGVRRVLDRLRRPSRTGSLYRSASYLPKSVLRVSASLYSRLKIRHD